MESGAKNVFITDIKGQTIYSFFGFKPDVTLESIKTIKAVCVDCASVGLAFFTKKL